MKSSTKEADGVESGMRRMAVRTMNASPMSYAAGGRQFVAMSAGNTLYAFALPAAD